MKNKTPHKAVQKQDWQTGSYANRQRFDLTIPQQLLCICKILDITPEQIVTDFLDNLACASWEREGRDKAKIVLIDYFIVHGYGQSLYTIAEIKQMFSEMDAVGMLFPKQCTAAFQDMHVRWREAYHQYWFDKWFNKNQRLI